MKNHYTSRHRKWITQLRYVNESDTQSTFDYNEIDDHKKMTNNVNIIISKNICAACDNFQG